MRESEEVSSTYSQHNALNQLKQIGGAGTTLVEGLVDEPAFVKVNGQEAIVLSQPGGDFLFRKQIAVNEGNNTITIEATDASGNSASNAYSVVVGGLQKTLHYDLNGNLRFQRSPDGTVLQAYQWDAKNRLVKILEGTQETEFAYDGKDRRVLKIERTHGSEISRTHYIWEGSNIVQSRAADASTLQRNYFQQGFQENAQNYYYTKDHLGSIREGKPKGHSSSYGFKPDITFTAPQATSAGHLPILESLCSCAPSAYISLAARASNCRIQLKDC